MENALKHPCNCCIFPIIFTGLFALNLLLSSCESKEPSVLKVFVRDENNDLLPKAKVIIIADTKSSPATMDYVDTLFSDAQGIALFNMDSFYEASGKKVHSGYFDVLVKYLNKQATGYVRTKEHITTVQTIRFEP